MPIEWYGKEHDFEERNNLYIQHTVDLGVQALLSCSKGGHAEEPIEPSMIDYLLISARDFNAEH